jgi:hypothetical protein
MSQSDETARDKALASHAAMASGSVDLVVSTS